MWAEAANNLAMFCPAHWSILGTVIVSLVYEMYMSITVLAGNQAYGLASRLGAVANPLACFFALFISRVSIATTSLLVFVGGVASGYQLYLAAMSPTPPLQDETVGAFLVVRVQHTYCSFCNPLSNVCVNGNISHKLLSCSAVIHYIFIVRICTVVVFHCCRCFLTFCSSRCFHTSKSWWRQSAATTVDACRCCGAAA